MHSSRTTLRVALLLGSALALAALTPAAGATLSRAQMERIMAATGKPATAVLNGGAAHSNAAIRTPGSVYAVLYNFAGGSSDGQYPSAEVTLDSSGNIYGTTDGGGAYSEGTLFKLTSSGTESLLHSFGASSSDGQIPDGKVFFDASGNMYGTTNYGGSGNGTLWELAAGGTYSVLHIFGSNEGSFIRGPLVEDKNGNLYGTALFGGANGDGSVFEYNITSATLTVLHSFDNTDGEFPEHGVVMDKNGNLYGVTAFGGSGGEGTVYEIASNGTFSTLHNFSSDTNGGFLYGAPAIDKKGNIYGSTASYGANNAGTVFKLAPDGTLTTLYSFTGGADGGSPEGDMLLVGKNLYDAATSGGANGGGGIFRVTLKGKETMLQSFATATGNGYSAGLTKSGKKLYGTTADGGSNGYGVVFSMTK